MAEVTVVPKRIGGSLAVFLPAELVKREGIREGVPCRILVDSGKRTEILGILRGLVPPKRFNRHEEGFEPEYEDRRP